MSGTVSHAGPPVSCADPDNLCTGNPCQIPALEVISPCVVDFGARDVEILGRLRVPNAGVLSFTAASISARTSIAGQHTSAGAGSGAAITFITTGDIRLRRVDASGRTSAGSIDLQAGGNVILSALLRTSARPGTATTAGGPITIDAGGFIQGSRAARLDARGSQRFGFETAGGPIDVTGLSVSLEGKVETRGSVGGDVDVVATGGDLLLGSGIDANSASGGGLGVNVNVDASAAGSVTIAGDQVRARGDAAGGMVVIVSGPGKTVTTESIDVRGNNGAGGIAFVFGSAGVAMDSIRASSSDAAGGMIGVSGGTGPVSGRNMDAEGETGGGTIGLVADGDVALGSLDVHSTTGDGGDISIVSDLGSIVDLSAVNAKSAQATGGSIELIANGTLTGGGNGIDASGEDGGSITIEAASIALVVNLRANGDTLGGTIVVDATAGDLNMPRDYEATGTTGGIVQATASGDIFASGDFRAAAGGCIGLSAGGTVDTTDGTFDEAIQPTCGA